MNKRLFTPFRVLLVVLLAGLSAIMLWPEVLGTMGLPLHRQWFADSQAILAANDAVRLGVDPTVSNPFDPFNRPHVYSDWWLGLRWLGLTRADNFAFGGVCCLAFLTVALAGLRPASYAAVAGLAAIFLAPPMLLALQRANNDLVIFALLGTGLLVLRSASGPVRLACFGGLVVLATGLKYYPIVALGALLAVLPWRRALGWSFGLSVAAALLVLWIERSSISRGMFELPRTIYTFGAQVLWRDVTPDRPALAAVAVALIALGAVLAWRRGWTNGLADGARGPEGERLMFAVGACVLIGCFLAGTSYAYRWIFGLWLWPWLWREAVAGRRAARLAFGCWLISLWADGVLGVVLNSLGSAYWPELGWRLIIQPFCWVLMVLLAGWLLEAVVTQARAWRGRLRTT